MVFGQTFIALLILICFFSFGCFLDTYIAASYDQLETIVRPPNQIKPSIVIRKPLTSKCPQLPRFAPRREPNIYLLIADETMTTPHNNWQSIYPLLLFLFPTCYWSVN